MGVVSTQNKSKPKSVAIVGGGLVGSLAACFLGRRGFEVHLFEYREDIRTAEHVMGKSINLAMSVRARAALKSVGLEDIMIKNHGIPMRARMIHGTDGSLREIPYDARTKQCIYSVSRRYLNEILLTATEKYNNVHLHFNQKLININFNDGEITLQNTLDKSTTNSRFDFVIGSDGAYSMVRRHMMKQAMFDYSQTYIKHGYMELCIPPDKEGKFAMPENFLHIWPRGQFMMIALPNQDKSWTVTLFMPFEKFSMLDSPEKLHTFFSEYFPDSIPLIGKDRLTKDFFKGGPQPLVSVKCSPYHVRDKALLIGDSAHAMVPFYGQGMNAGFEDCSLLDDLIEKFGDENMENVFKEFTEKRVDDAHAICDLAMYNYIEMRDLVNKKSYRLRKTFDDFLFWIAPQVWVPLYNSVSFTRMSYRKCIENRAWQDKVLSKAIFTLSIGGALSIFGAAFYFGKKS
ncbi:kynurenine 3-monooxygenase-like, partial [Ctenocephalides felis]|uniref:kynurenine 3-monooxygenase-like n=1 Tax=Ctenocephalides felis TaxID=7515 RepID=UPI000E6E3A8C